MSSMQHHEGLAGCRRITDPCKAYLDYRQGSGDTWEIFDLHVPDDGRRRGVGRRMVESLITQAAAAGVRTVFAVTRASNGPAIAFYTRLGFRPIPLFDFYKDEPLHRSISYKRYADAVMYVHDLKE